MKLQQGFGINGMGQRDLIAARQFLAAHVRYGSKADIGAPPSDVCFTPKSGHQNRLRYVDRSSSGSLAMFTAIRPPYPRLGRMGCGPHAKKAGSMALLPARLVMKLRRESRASKPDHRPLRD